jgi:hypothetical protein
MKTKYFIGIDPGKTGGIAAINRETGELILHTIPLIGTEINVAGIVDIIKQYINEPHFFCLEDVHSIPGSSASSNFTFGKVLGIEEASLIAFEATFQKVAPKKWQSLIWQGIPKMKKASGGNDTKAMSLLAAQRLFPKEKFLATPRSTKPHDGLVDAALMAKYLELSYGI